MSGLQVLIDFSRCESDMIGKNNGLSEQDKANIQMKFRDIQNKIATQRKRRSIGFLNVPYEHEVIHEIFELASQHENRWENVVIIGIGGSSLGVTMLFSCLCHPYHNLLTPRQRNNIPRFFILDNIDPILSNSLTDFIDIQKTLFIIITKSGHTIETWSNFYRFLSDFSLSNDQIIAITDPCKGYLRKIAHQERWATLSIPPDVGGRFSVLTPVGLFPATLMGIPINDLIEGAKLIDKISFEADNIHDNHSVKLALYYWYYLTQKRKSIHVMMPYSNSLYSFADWFRQLWAESLGKKYDVEGGKIHTGQTPVKAIGATDQHSQIQLYREGPDDKFFTFIKLNHFLDNKKLIHIPEDSPWRILKNLTLGEILNIELEATIESLSLCQRPLITISLSSLTPYSLGQLIYVFELITWLTGEALNINPFNQPGVEEGKKLTRNIIINKQKG